MMIIAVEIAGILKTLGSDVSLFIRYDQVLRNFDSIVRDQLMNEMKNSGINIRTNSDIANLYGDPSSIAITTKVVQFKTYVFRQQLITIFYRVANHLKGSIA